MKCASWVFGFYYCCQKTSGVGFPTFAVPPLNISTPHPSLAGSSGEALVSNMHAVNVWELFNIWLGTACFAKSPPRNRKYVGDFPRLEERWGDGLPGGLPPTVDSATVGVGVAGLGSAPAASGDTLSELALATSPGGVGSGTVVSFDGSTGSVWSIFSKYGDSLGWASVQWFSQERSSKESFGTGWPSVIVKSRVGASFRVSDFSGTDPSGSPAQYDPPCEAVQGAPGLTNMCVCECVCVSVCMYVWDSFTLSLSLSLSLCLWGFICSLVTRHVRGWHSKGWLVGKFSTKCLNTLLLHLSCITRIYICAMCIS